MAVKVDDVKVTVPSPSLSMEEIVGGEVFRPCDMCRVMTVITVNIGKRQSPLCTPHAQAAVALCLKRGLRTITFTR